MFVVKSNTYDATFLEMVTPISSTTNITQDEVDQMLLNRGKMQLAKRIWQNITDRLSITNDREKAAVFHHLLQTHLNCTKATSCNYLNNLTSPNGMYTSNKKYNKQVRDAIRAQKQPKAVDVITESQPIS